MNQNSYNPARGTRGGRGRGRSQHQVPPPNAPTGPRPMCCQLHHLNPNCGLGCNGVTVVPGFSTQRPTLYGPAGFAPSAAPPPPTYNPQMGQPRGGPTPPMNMPPPRGPRNHSVNHRNAPTFQQMPGHVLTQHHPVYNTPAAPSPFGGYHGQSTSAMGHQQQRLNPSPAPHHFNQQFPPAPPPAPFFPPSIRPTPTPTGPSSFQLSTSTRHHAARQPSATYNTPTPHGQEATEDLSGPLSLAALRDVSFTKPATASSAPPRASAHPPPPPARSTPSSAASPSPPADSPHTNLPPPQDAWQPSTRKSSHARFDLRLSDLELGMIVHLKPNATWGTGRHPGLVCGWKDAGYVEILVGTSFLGQGMVGKMGRIREAHERARIGREYLRVGGDGGDGEDYVEAYAGLGLPVLRLRGGRVLKKTTYFRFVYRFHCELADICKYADGRSLKNKYVLDEASWEACRAYLEHRLPLMRRAEAEVRRQQRERDRAAERQRVQDEMRRKVAEAANALQSVTQEETDDDAAESSLE
ncbi:uncharacterized protein BKCO1_6900023 [Diplodia corticola]|uniref:Uncharacterized protein n=1 Tax=Diplodia corticola TaxID=236234 RepID=A0A1J9RQW9_9PEZI|nr:uncharacterized protein BKCO1_6900023 [Diplodia corticola]OJD29941.1 hypothetical protein BKCO1_6900023 [Diplodia corticola]